MLFGYNICGGVKGSFMHNGSDETFWELLTFLIWENRASAKVEKIFLKYVQTLALAKPGYLQ